MELNISLYPMAQNIFKEATTVCIYFKKTRYNFTFTMIFSMVMG